MESITFASTVAYNIHQLFQITKGQLLKVAHERPIEHLLLDSRKIVHPASSVFFAVKGERKDGHQFIADLYEKGVRTFIIEDDVDLLNYPDGNFIQVKNTIAALQQITAFHRQQFQYPVIGITGSNGKTMVKEWLNQLLESDYNIVRSPKSYNSQIGVPLSVWQMNAHHNLAIFEAGISQPNEMDKLEKVIKPTIGIFTNIGHAHDQGFLNVRQKVNEKLQLFSFAQHIIYCRDYDELNNAIVTFKSKLADDHNANRFNLFTWSLKSDADLKITNITKSATKASIEAIYKNETITIEINFTDNASIENAINCWATLLLLEKNNETIAARFKQLTPVGMRLELKEANNDCSLINDSYSSDTSSLAIALDFLQQQQQHTHKAVILSDILQSGKNDFDLYTEVAEMLKTKNISKFIGIGKAIGKQEKVFQTLTNTALHFYTDTDSFLGQHQFDTFQHETILLKGARVFEFEKISKLFEKKAHETVLEINLNALVHNLKTYQAMLQPTTKIMAMVKAFSYGSGGFEIANLLQFHKVDYLAVAYADEGVELRNAGISLPIMVMCPEERSFDTIIKNKLEPEIYSIEMFELLLEQIKTFYAQSTFLPVPVHIELETGMNRLGFNADDLEKLISLLKENADWIKVQSVFTHLAASEDAVFDDFTNEQIATYKTAVAKIETEITYPFIKHILNSGGIVRHTAHQLDMVRLGVGLYGADSSNQIQQQLKVVSTLKTTVLQVKEIEKNETIGYSRRGKLKAKGRIATVGLGYADGLHRTLGNGKGSMLINGELVKIVGSICMDMCMLDVTNLPHIQPGDEVIVFGENPTIQQFAEWEGTITYEILTNISKRVRRVYFEE